MKNKLRVSQGAAYIDLTLKEETHGTEPVETASGTYITNDGACGRNKYWQAFDWEYGRWFFTDKVLNGHLSIGTDQSGKYVGFVFLFGARRSSSGQLSVKGGEIGTGRLVQAEGQSGMNMKQEVTWEILSSDVVGVQDTSCPKATR